MRTQIRLLALCTVAILAPACANQDKPNQLDTSAPLAGPNFGAVARGGCTTTIGDRIWFDTNCNGIQDKDENGGPEGIKVTLRNCDNNDTIGTVTDAGGFYSFPNVPAGTYQICVEIPGGFAATLEDEGTNDGIDSDINAEGCTGCRTYECDKPDLTRDIGLCEKKGQPTGCRFTGGGNSEYNGDVYTFGGQAGANTALQPQPAGEWEHNQHSGPDGSFGFHGGTHSAPDGTEIDRIECMDDGYCRPARKAPSHQLDFWGVGQFHNAKNLPASLASKIEVSESLHWFEVNIDDAGEPGKATDADCPEDGFGLHGSEEFVNCDCGDFYRITIRATEDPSSEVIYTVHGYFTGNFQIHPLTGFDRH